MQINQIGINIRHEGKFVIDRPNGSGDFLFLIFQTRAKIVINKKEIEVQPDGCILYEKNEKQFYFSSGKTYVDSYLHFDLSYYQLKKSKVPLNTLFYLKNSSEIIEILKLLSREQISESTNKNENSNLLLCYLLSKIFDNKSDEPVSQKQNILNQKLIELRSQMYSNASLYKSVSDLAKEANVSLSHFKFLYTKQFGISCYDDLLTAKTMNAQHHLLKTDLSIKEIAILCGYENDTSFMRSFKKRTGKTPSEFRTKKLQ